MLLMNAGNKLHHSNTNSDSCVVVVVVVFSGPISVSPASNLSPVEAEDTGITSVLSVSEIVCII